MFLKISNKIYRKIPISEFLNNKVASLTPAALLKKAPTQLFSYEFGKIFKNNFFTELLQAKTDH